jgi:hypothetical protein
LEARQHADSQVTAVRHDHAVPLPGEDAVRLEIRFLAVD